MIDRSIRGQVVNMCVDLLKQPNIFASLTPVLKQWYAAVYVIRVNYSLLHYRHQYICILFGVIIR